MSRTALVGALALALAACASSPDPVVLNAASVSPGAGPPPPSAAEPAPARSGPTAAGWAVSIVGTPFALAFKAVVCTASVVVAAPVAGFLALGVDPSGEGYEALGDGLAQNCGPPYVVSPYAAS